MSAAVGPPGPGWHLLSAPVPSADGATAASDGAADARAIPEAIPTDAMALPQHEPSSVKPDREVGDTMRRGAHSGKPRRRGEGAASGRGAALRATSLTALVEGEQACTTSACSWSVCTHVRPPWHIFDCCYAPVTASRHGL